MSEFDIDPTHATTTVDDELPAPPSASTTPGDSPAVDGAFDADVVKQADKLGDPIPAGTYSFRFESHTTGWGEESKAEGDKAKFQYLGDQPYFMIRWVCTQEPETGRSFFLYTPWVNAATFKAVKSGDPIAKELVKSRLMVVRTLLEGIEYKGPADINKFFELKPECKLVLSVRDKKVKDPRTGQYVATGEQQNQLLKVFPLYKSAV